jgi:hypothetical protein
MVRIVDFGFVVVFLVVIVGLGTVGVMTLMGWSYVIDKLRFMRKQDEKEKVQ